MFKPVVVSEDIFYVGVNDRTKHLFEALWPIPLGVSYNSYLIIDEKVALIDTVDVCYSDTFLKKVETLLNGRSIDYLVINHMEPDHSGSIRLLKQFYPSIQIIGNKKTADMLAGFYQIDENIQEVKDKEEISLGKHTLRFYMTPMVHWPETMMTYDLYTETLFSGDGFGTYGSLNGGVIDKAINVDLYWDEMIRYYATIVGKYGSPVQKALEKLAPVPVRTICSTHGPVWQEKISEVISVYDKLSRYEGEEGVVIAYGSMYGNTEQMAEIIATELSEQGVHNIIMYNVSKTHVSYILRDIFKYKGLIIGSPTYSNELFPLVQSLIDKIDTRDIKNRLFGHFGSFIWAGAAVKRLTAFVENRGWEVVGDPVEQKCSLTAQKYEECVQLAKAMARKLKEK
ncbi:MAG: FprA family A-type flavoprotein [Candidatus Azobacteroides sp.]|nr:FprA family A-type flavoprotein [Candidatus Azobacteroides sp.]